MKQLNFKGQVIIHIILIIIILGLSFKIAMASFDYDCNECIVSFKYERVSFDDFILKNEINMTSNELYEGYLNDECPVFWDKVNGYMKDG